MSYPSITQISEQKKVNLEGASTKEVEEMLWDAFHVDLNEGMNYLAHFSKEVKDSQDRIMKIEDPNSSLGKQIIRLLGTDIARNLLEKRLGIAFGLYNCCAAVGAPTKEELHMSAHEQVQLQNGVLATADC